MLRTLVKMFVIVKPTASQENTKVVWEPRLVRNAKDVHQVYWIYSPHLTKHAILVYDTASSYSHQGSILRQPQQKRQRKRCALVKAAQQAIFLRRIRQNALRA
jgi:hypothetical protein